MNLGMRFNMFGQPWVTGLRADQSMLRAGSNTILDMGEDGNYNITSPNGNIEEATNKSVPFGSGLEPVKGLDADEKDIIGHT